MYTQPENLIFPLYFVGPNPENESVPPKVRGGGSGMAEASTPKRVIYACGLVAAVSILFLMIYSGVFEGAGEALFELAKEIVKFFLG